jgi:oligopeptide/dipeptide ABC transporter ATP-binding protein
LQNSTYNMEMNELLNIEKLTIGYKTPEGMIRAVDQVNFTLEAGEILGLVGESGCGKSTVFYSIMGLLPKAGKLVEGKILFEGKDISENKPKEWLSVRGKDIAMIFQDPMSALNPAYTVGKQIREMITAHERGKGSLAVWKQAEGRRLKERVLKLMRDVGIPDPDKRYDNYPHELSGGMQQRILIAMALACSPKLLLADEPTTALDVTIQAQILELLKDINKSKNTSILLVTHDLGVASEFCQKIAVMYAGRIVEYGLTEAILQNPVHPYTRGLLESIPTISLSKKKIKPIKGNVIDLCKVKEGCAFYDRCDYAKERCKKPVPMTELSNRHQVRCTLVGSREVTHDGSVNGITAY